MIDHLLEVAGEFRPAEENIVMDRAYTLRHHLLVPGFRHGPIVKADRKGMAWLVRRSLGDQSRNERGVEPAAQVKADVNVSLQAILDGPAEQMSQSLRTLLFRFAVIELAAKRVVQIPILLELQGGALDDQIVTGLQALDTFEHRPRADQPGKGEDLIEPGQIHFSPHFRVSKNRLDLGTENELVTGDGIEQRIDAELIPSKEQLPLAAVVDDEGELAVDAVEEGGPGLFVQVHQHLDVAVRAEDVTFFPQLFAEFPVVEDLAVAHEHNRAVLVAHRLLAVLQVDDLQAPETEGHGSVAEGPGRVGPAMNQGTDHPRQRFGVHPAGIAQVIVAGEAAHRVGFPSSTTYRSPKLIMSPIATSSLRSPSKGLRP